MLTLVNIISGNSKDNCPNAGSFCNCVVVEWLLECHGVVILVSDVNLNNHRGWTKEYKAAVTFNQIY